MHAFLDGLLAGYGIAIPVGAIALLIVNTAVQCGFRIGLAAGAGAATADSLYAAVAAVAGTAVVSLLQPVALPLRALGGAVLLALGILGIRQGMKGSVQEPGSADACPPLRMYAQFLGLTLINPMTVVYFSAFILGRGAGFDSTLDAQLLFVAGAGLSSLSWQALLAAVGGLAKHHLSERFRRWTVIAGNLLILSLGAQMLASVLLNGG